MLQGSRNILMLRNMELYLNKISYISDSLLFLLNCYKTINYFKNEQQRSLKKFGSVTVRV